MDYPLSATNSLALKNKIKKKCFQGNEKIDHFQFNIGCKTRIVAVDSIPLP